MTTPTVLPARPCPGCQVFDDHPRHVVALDGGGDATYHMDCCAERGCKVCAHVLGSVNHQPGLVGDALRERLVAREAELIQHADHNPYGEIQVTGRG